MKTMREIKAGIEWEVLDPSNIPEGLVMAANFDKQSDYYGEQLIGYLCSYVFGNHVGVYDNIAPTSANINIPRITHYIEL